MDKKLNDLLIIDQKIGDFFYDNSSLSDEELNNKFENENFVREALKIIKKLSNKSVLELLKRSQYLPSFINMKSFMKKYPINKSYLKKNKDMYPLEYQRLRKTCDYLCDISTDYNEFLDYMRILDIYNVEKYLLENMTNEQIYELSCHTGEWEEKLFYFSFLKKKSHQKI